MATTTAQASTPLEQRVRRFLEEDVTTFAMCSTFGTGLFAAREYHSVAAKMMPTGQRVQRALRKTLPIVPAILLSSAVGIIGMKVTLAAVQDARRDYSRTSVLIAVPLFAALIHAPAGPRAMAKSAVGYGAFILAADLAASEYHHYNAIKMEMQQAEQDHHDADLHRPAFHLGSDASSWNHTFQAGSSSPMLGSSSLIRTQK